MNEALTKHYWALRIGFGATAFLAGLDKFLHLLADWTMYLSPLAEKLIPIEPATLMKIFGVVEMAVGITILAGFVRLGGFVAGVWLLAIAGNLVTTGMFFDVAVRDVVMSIAAFTLSRMAALREPASATVRAASLQPSV